MPSRLLALAGALALALGGLLMGAGPAAADPAHCSGWTNHPDLYNAGGIHFLNGTYIRTGPYTDCSALGQGFPSQGINAHCAVVNSNNVAWVYVVDTSTGVAGWSALSALNWDGSPIPIC